ncbi:MAG: hypothetical protein Q4C89_09335 [Deinococcus sp.]|uniref:hypothetical protein n=1 Tax=Deinococcus sp. TaxID=47478 RepID=UPI0026DC097D|nr:hypothetical protein [Deinococcus sp.]MDO4246213.1 hypothetical protein [Deinococcus sp.]
MAAELQWGSRGKPTPYPITDDAREALEEQGITDVPKQLTLYLRSATGRERKKFQARLQTCKSEDDLREMLADLLLTRMDQGSDRRIVREVLEDADQTAMNQLQYAYVNGVIPEGKALERAVQATAARLTPRALDALAVTSRPSSQPSTESDPGSGTV